MKNPSFLTLRLPDVIGTTLAAAAAASNSSISGFARAAIVAALPDAGSLPPLRPSPPPAPRRPIVIPDADVAAIARLGGHLGRLAGATIQLSKVCREGGSLPEHDALEVEIRDLRQAKAEIVAMVGRLRAAVAQAS